MLVVVVVVVVTLSLLLDKAQAVPAPLIPQESPRHVLLERATPRIRNENGMVSLERLNQEIAHLERKYERNRMNLAKTQQRRSPSQRLSRRASSLALNMPSVAVWTGRVSIGTPAQSFDIYFDTGSADFTVASSKCSVNACGNKKRYNLNNSSTGKSTGAEVETNYVDGTRTAGTIITDTVKVAGISVKGQGIVASTALSSTVKGLDADGLMGLAFPDLSGSGFTTLPWTQYEQNASNSRFGLRLSNTDGQSSLTFGGVNQAQISGNLIWYKVSKTSGAWGYTYWQIDNSSPFVGNSAVLSPRVEHILDSGTTLIIAPPKAAAAFWAKVPGAKKYDSQSWTYPCASPPKVGFVLGGQKNQWLVPTSSFNLGAVDSNLSRCMGAVLSMDLGLGTAWVLGDSFLTNVYAVFDVKNKQVGLALSK